MDSWAETLEFLRIVAENAEMADLMSNPAVSHEQKLQLMLDIGEDRLSEEAQNLVRLLVENGRLMVVPQIADLFQKMKNEAAGAIDVDVTSAYVLKPAMQKKLAAALEKKFGRAVNINSVKDPSLIGGIKIRAGDLVIDGSIAGQLSRLAHQLGI